MLLVAKDAEYIKTVEEAWKEAVELANLAEGWKEEKADKKTVRCIVVIRRIDCIALSLSG